MNNADFRGFFSFREAAEAFSPGSSLIKLQTFWESYSGMLRNPFKLKIGRKFFLPSHRKFVNFFPFSTAEGKGAEGSLRPSLRQDTLHASGGRLPCGHRLHRWPAQTLCPCAPPAQVAGAESRLRCRPLRKHPAHRLFLWVRRGGTLLRVFSPLL